MAQIIHVGSGSGEKRANVIFLHGLGGDPRTTSQHGPDEQSFWPGWLAEDIRGLAVYSIGYEASVSRWRGTAMHLADRAANVLARILAEPELQSGQLILIGHSLGGLVIKQLLQNAESEGRHNTEAASFLKRVDKVAFLATPHTGSDLAAFGNRIAYWQGHRRPRHVSLEMTPTYGRLIIGIEHGLMHAASRILRLPRLMRSASSA